MKKLKNKKNERAKRGEYLAKEVKIYAQIIDIHNS